MEVEKIEVQEVYYRAYASWVNFGLYWLVYAHRFPSFSLLVILHPVEAY